MKRVVCDVPRWSVYLHREARALPPHQVDDGLVRRFEDELFERLYASEAERLPEGERDSKLAAWAERFHAACDALPDFARLVAECRGDADAAAAAMEEVLRVVQPREDEPTVPKPEDAAKMRRALRAACSAASAAVDEARSATEGLEQVAFIGPGAGVGSQRGEMQTGVRPRELARRIKNDQRLQRISMLAGRFKRIAEQKRKSRVRHGADEVADVEIGGDLGRLLPAELAKLAHPRRRLALLRDLLERQCLQYRLEGAESLGRGPLVVCLDKSGSMQGERDVWSVAVALALLDQAQHERRIFALLDFDDSVKGEVVVKPGEKLPETELFVTCTGGTNITRAIARALDVVEQHPGALRKADVVLITDGDSSVAGTPALRERAAALGAIVLGFGIEVEVEKLRPWCDEAHAVLRLDTLDDKSAEALFGG